MIEKSFIASDSNLESVTNYVLQGIINLSKKCEFEISLLVEEIFVNIAHYATPDKEMYIKKEIKDNILTVSFIDNGNMFNPLDKKDPDISLDSDERNIGGLGIFMIRKYSNSVSYEYINNQNILTITKELVYE